MNIQQWISKNTHSLSGKRVAITGSTGGIGKELCMHLAALGANLVLINRNEKSTLDQINTLTDTFPNIEVSYININLENFESVKIATEKIIDQDIDVFIHNAGAYNIPRHKCDTGYDNIFQINFVSPYYIIRELSHLLKKKNGRVVVVGSIAHAASIINSSDIDFTSIKSAEMVYGNSKRYLMFSLYEFFKDKQEVDFAITHPGITLTNLMSNYPKFISKIIKYPMQVIFMPPRMASLSILKGVFENTEYHNWIGPGILNIWGMPKKRQLKSCSIDESKKIADIAEEVYMKIKSK